jgi:hypothetical protein
MVSIDIHSRTSPAKGTSERGKPEKVSMNMPWTRAAPPKAILVATFRDRALSLRFRGSHGPGF